jgi:hypothetical protein
MVICTEVCLPLIHHTQLLFSCVFPATNSVIFGLSEGGTPDDKGCIFNPDYAREQAKGDGRASIWRKIASIHGRFWRGIDSLSTRLRACWLIHPPIDLKVAKETWLWLLSPKCLNMLIRL